MKYVTCPTDQTKKPTPPPAQSPGFARLVRSMTALAGMALLASLLYFTNTASAQTTLMFKYPMDAAHSSATATTNDLTVGAALNTPIPLLLLGTTKNQPTDIQFLQANGTPIAGYYFADMRGGANSGVQSVGESLNFTNVVNPGAFAPYTLMAVGVTNAALASMGDGVTPGSTFSSFVGTCWINMSAPTVGAADGQGPVLWMLQPSSPGNQAPGTANTICFRFNSRPGTIGNPAQSCNGISNTFEVRISNAASVEAPIYFPQATNLWMFFGVIYNATNQNGYIYYGTEGSPVKLMGIKNIGARTITLGSVGSLSVGNIINTWVRHFDGRIADLQFYTGAPGGDAANQAFLEAIRQQRTPVVITNLYPDGMSLMQGTNKLTFMASSATGINPTNIHVTVNGTDVSRSLIVSGTSTARTVSYTGLPVNQFIPPSANGFAPNLNAVKMTLSVTDSNGITANNVYTYDDFSPANYTWEAEDYDFTSGQYIDNPAYSFQAAVNAYFSKNGTSPVDYSTVNSIATFYRAGDTVGTELSLSSTTDNGNQNNGNMGELMRSKVLALLDLNASGLEDIREADVTGFTSGNWMNYTRTYPTGYFNVYLRGASFRGVASVVGSGVSATLSQVTSGWGTGIQTSNVLGTFSVTNTGGSEDYAWIPLVNGGTNAIILLGGTNTLNLAAGTNNGTGSQAFNLNFLMLVERPVPGFLVQPTNTTTVGGFPASFFSQVFATNTITYQWQQAPPASTTFTNVPNANSASYTTPNLPISLNQEQYRVLATSGGFTITSVVAVVTVTPSTPPVLLGALDDFQGITVAFSQPIDPVSGANTAHYALNGGAHVTGASVSGNSVLLTPSSLTFGQNYTLVVNNVSNNFGGVIAANSTTNFGAYTFFAKFDGGAFPVIPAYANLYGSAATFSTGGTTNSGGTNSSGRLQFAGAPNQSGSVVFPDALNGGSLTNFEAAFNLQFAFPSTPPGDNFSFNLANDVPDGAFGAATGTGLSLNIALSGTISVRYQGATAINTNDNSLLTASIDTSATGLSDGVFRQVIFKVAADGSLTVVIGGVGYFSGAVIQGWTPLVAPKLGIGGACGGNSVQMSIDDLQVVYNGTLPLPLPPTVVITSPANNSTYNAGDTVPVTVNAVPNGHAITKVEYFVNGTEVFTNTVAPYSYSPGLVNVGNQVYNIVAKVTDNINQSSTSTTVQIVAGNPRQILFVTGGPPNGPTGSDIAFMTYLSNRGFQVFQQQDSFTLSSDVPGKVLVVISSTVVSTTIDPNFSTVAVPLLLWEPADQGLMLFTPVNNNVASSSQITIVNPASPLAAGLSGTVSVLTGANTIGWGSPATNAITVGVIAGSTTNYCLYAYESGSLLYDGSTPAPARRVFTFLYDNSYPSITPAGQQLIDASIAWLLAPPLTSVVSGNTLTLTWPAGATLQEASVVTGPWSDLSTSGTLSTNMNLPAHFYRVKQ